MLLQVIDEPQDKKIADFLEKRKLEESKQEQTRDRSGDDETTIEMTNDTNKIKFVLPKKKLIKNNQKHVSCKNPSELIFREFKKG